MFKESLIRLGMSLLIKWVLSTRSNDELTDVLASVIPRPLAVQLVGLITQHYNWPLQPLSFRADYFDKL